MAIEASLRDLQRDGSKQEESGLVEEEEEEDDEEGEEQDEEEEDEEVDEIEMEEAGGTSDEQIESVGEYKSDKGNRGRRKAEEVSRVEQEKKDTPRTVKEKKEVLRMEKEKERRRRAEMGLMKGCDSPSLEGLTEMDIKRKLIERAKIKSKVARQGSSEAGDKIRRKSKKQENCATTEEKEKKRKSSSDVYEDPSLSSKKRRSSVSRERLSDVKSSPKCDIGQVRGLEGGGLRSKEANFERSTVGESGKTESTKSGE